MSLCSGPSVDQSPGSVSWELFQDKGRTWRSAAEGVHTYSEEVREREGTRNGQNNCFCKKRKKKKENRKTSCQPPPCVVIAVTAMVLGGCREGQAHNRIDVHCNGKH